MGGGAGEGYIVGITGVVMVTLKMEGFGGPGLVKDVPAHGRGLDWISFTGPLQPKPVCDSILAGGNS